MNRVFCILLANFVLMPSGSAQSVTGVISTVAGTGARGYGGDGGPATAALLNQPYGVNVVTGGDGKVYLYIADTYNNRIRRINLADDGRIETVAGSATPGFGGDGQQATAASLNIPTGTVVTPQGTLLIADFNNSRIRSVSADGVIRTLGGSAERGYAGDGGPATQAQFFLPMNLALTAGGSVIVADRDNHRIRRIDPAGNVSTFAGSDRPGFGGDGGPATAAQLAYPTGVAVQSDGTVLIADWGNHRVRRVGLDGNITTVAGSGAAGFGGDGGPATRAQLNEPRMLLPTADGFLIADSMNHRIRKVYSATGVIETIVGSGVADFGGDGGPALAARLNAPQSMALAPDGSLYIAERDNDRIRRVVFSQAPAAQNELTISTAQLTFGGASSAFVRVSSTVSPMDITVSADVPWLSVSPAQGKTPLNVEVVANSGELATGTYQGVITVAGSNPAQPRQIGVTLVVPPPMKPATSRNGTIITVAGTGTRGFGGDGGPATAALFHQPYGVHAAVGPDANTYIYIADTFNQRVRRINVADGKITTVAGSELAGFAGDGQMATRAALNVPTAAVMTPDGSLLIADFNNSRIRRVAADSTISTVAGISERGFSGDGGPSGQAQLFLPMNMALGRGGILLFADRDNHRIRQIDLAGNISTIAGTDRPAFGGDGGPANEASLRYPTGVAVEADGGILIADWGNQRVRRVGLDGIITTVAGNGEMGGAGDGGPATAAELNEPRTIAATTDGFFIVDSKNHRIRKVDYATGVIETIAGTGIAGFDGDGGPASAARLNSPQSISFGPDGSLYIADMDNDRIRRVVFESTVLAPTPGTLQLSSSQIDVTGTAGGAAPAVQTVTVTSSGSALEFTAAAEAEWLRVSPAQGRTPAVLSIAVDASKLGAGTYKSNVTIDSANATTPRQVIAVTVTLSRPLDILSAAPGNVLFTWQQGTADPAVQTVRVTSQQAGTAVNFEVAGGGSWLTVAPSSGRTPFDATVRARPNDLSPGQYSATLTAIGENTAEPLRLPIALRVNPAATPQNIRVDPVSITFQWPSDGPGPEPQNFTVIVSGGDPVTYTINSRTSSGGNWLSIGSSRFITPSNGEPLQVQLRANPAGLTPGNYDGEVTLEAGGVVRARLQVYFLVTRRINSELLIDTTLVQLSAPTGTVAATGQVTVKNPSPANLNFSVLAETSDGTNWLRANPSGSTLGGAASGSPAMVTITGDATGLAPGTYTGAIQLSADSGGGLSGQSVRVPVVFAVSDRSTDLFVSESSMYFSVQQGRPTTLDMSVVSVGRSPANWSASVTKGANWLRLDRGQGVSTPGSAPQIFDAIADGAAIGPGEYSGEIQVRWDGAARPIVIPVKCRVSAGRPDPTPRPSSLAFVPASSGGDPQARTVYLESGFGDPLVGADPSNPTPGTSWLSITRIAGGLSVSAKMDALQPGTPYRASAFVTYPGNSSVTLQILAIKPLPGVANDSKAKAAGGCQPQRFFPLFSSTQPSFSAQAGEAVRAEVVVVDDCGQLASDAAAGSTFSNRERPLTLTSLGEGRWSATWVPKTENAGEVAVEALTTNSARTATASPIRVRAFVRDAVEGQPLLRARLPLVGVDGKEPLAVAPGSLLELRGKNLATGGAVTVTLGGLPLQLQSAATDRVVVVVPANFDGRGLQSLIVASGDRLSAAETIVVADVWPTVASADATSLLVSGIAMAVDSPALMRSVRFEVNGWSCRTGRTELQSPGLWRVEVSGCAGTTFAAGVGSVQTQGSARR